jgi:acetyl esterase/lipase
MPRDPGFPEWNEGIGDANKAYPRHLLTCNTPAFAGYCPALYISKLVDVQDPPHNDESKHRFHISIGVEVAKGFPPTWIIDCEKDCLRDDGRVL